jgi:hypothetical protein
MLPLMLPAPPVPKAVVLEFPMALFPPDPPLAKTGKELVELTELNQESPPETETPVTEFVFEAHVPTLM